MENKPFENLSDLSARMDLISARLEALERAVRKLGIDPYADADSAAAAIDADSAAAAGSAVASSTATDAAPATPDALSAIPASDEAIDLSLDIIPEAESELPDEVDLPAGEDIPAGEEDIPVLEDAPVAEDLPVEEDNPVAEGNPVAEDMPAAGEMPEEKEDLPQAEGFDNLFGAEFSDVPVVKPRRGRKPSVTTVNENASSTTGASVMDVMAQKRAWLHDIPGPEVRSLRSAIALGDQVLFIRRLFRDDSALYQDSIERLNSMPTLEKAVSYISETFPEWDMDSEDVYRFMMALRRRIRK